MVSAEGEAGERESNVQIWSHSDLVTLAFITGPYVRNVTSLDFSPDDSHLVTICTSVNFSSTLIPIASVNATSK